MVPDVHGGGQMWAPQLIGCMIASSLYGVALGQSWFYWRAFPRDAMYIKYLVITILVLDTVHTYTTVSIASIYLINGRRDNFPAPYIPWQLNLAGFLVYFTTFTVQSFYALRVWIISARNRPLTAAILLTSSTCLVLGLLCVALGATSGVNVLYSTPLYACAALVRFVCDILITGSVVFYLREGRTGIKRTETLTQHIIVVSVNMGLITCFLSLSIFILYIVQHGQYYISAPTAMLTKCYTNSLLTVLNARKSVRHQDQVLHLPTLSLST
ncbi:hypothetical protein SERLADRAFT_380940 [Serpula lacrymans var. lacrymans S7.9]|nr:uncharacterized protein SERLADRAFT_380940 [Serpula lacrymans var. lacrymans S7.9]EGO28810.1 hypothetical protein SERLADRAFT_380940 [Serpula lacrymans var. lacrymans S7.9]